MNACAKKGTKLQMIPIGAAAGASGSASSASWEPSSSVQFTPRPGAGEGDMVSIRRSLLVRLLDSVERASVAASHAVKISTMARDGFEEEKRRLDECAREVQRYVDIPVVARSQGQR